MPTTTTRTGEMKTVGIHARHDNTNGEMKTVGINAHHDNTNG